MFVTSSKYEKLVASIWAEDTEICAAVAFWGKGAETLIPTRPGARAKIMCNLASGATNPDVIDVLLTMNGIQLRQHDRLHAKVLIGSEGALVGSANFSSNGLNLEGSELHGWHEAGLISRNPSEIRAMKRWFRDLWNESRAIRAADIAAARTKWKNRRATRITRPPSSTGFTLGNLKLNAITDRKIYVAIYRDAVLSDEAKKAHKRYQQEIGAPRPSHDDELPDMYEGWPELPTESLLIDLYYGPRGGLSCDGIFVRSHDVRFRYPNGKEGHLAVCRKEDAILDHQAFGKREAAAFVADLRPCIQEIWDSQYAIGDEEGKYINLADVVAVYQSSRRKARGRSL